MQGRRRTIERMTRAAVRALRDARSPHMVVGAMSAGVWGTPRFTADADFVAAVTPEALPPLLRAFARRGFTASSRHLPAQWKEAGSVRIPFRQDPVLFHVDLIAANSDYDRLALRRSRPRRLFGLRVRVATAEDVIVYKLLSWRPQDRLDVGAIVRRRGRSLDAAYIRRWVRWIARRYPVFADAPGRLREALTRPLRWSG